MERIVEELIVPPTESVLDVEGRELNTPTRKVREKTREFWNSFATAADNKNWESKELEKSLTGNLLYNSSNCSKPRAFQPTM